MATIYVEIPSNWSEIEKEIILVEDEIIEKIFDGKKIYFYDTCSFRRHSNLEQEEKTYLNKYFHDVGAVVVITRCVLMELSSTVGYLHEKYVQYIKNLHSFGIPVLIMNEETIFNYMSLCFASSEVINSYLSTALRLIPRPVSTISTTLKLNPKLTGELFLDRDRDSKELFKTFFSEVRKNKEHEDNLGEELIGICVYLLSHVPGEEENKYTVLTDDKSGAAKISSLISKGKSICAGTSIIIFSTPRLIQHMHFMGMLDDKKIITNMLKAGSSDTIGVKSALLSDISAEDKSFTAEELADLILQPDAIKILF